MYTNLAISILRITRDGKEPSLLGFGSVRVLQKIGVRFGSSSLQAQKQWDRFCSGSSVETRVRFCSGSSVETRVRFCSVLYGNVRQFQVN